MCSQREPAAVVPEQNQAPLCGNGELSQRPPSYASHETEPLPSYAPPAYTPAARVPSTIQPATTKVPSALSGYWQWKLTRTVLLGVSAEKALFAVSTHTHLFSNRQSIVLHDGPSSKHPPLATLESDITGSKRPCIITVPRNGETPSQGPVVVELDANPERKYHKEPSFSFSCVVGEGKTATEEEFEWRRSHGKEIKELDKYSSGWKLVRMSAATATCDVVALLAHNSSMSMTKAFRFAVRGSGILGTMGRDWEVMTLISAVHMFNLDLQTAATLAATT
ncbi:hypothetical protein BJX96DRAFT_155725 [Aspergillus floccosus]